MIGEGPLDLLWVPGFVSHVELYWADPAIAAFMRRLSSFARLIVFDKRGTGLSDPVAGIPSVDERMDDLHAVLDAADSARPALFGISEGGPVSVLFAATHPDRVRALLLYGTIARGTRDEEHPWGLEDDAYRRMSVALDRWGEGRASRCSRRVVRGGALHDRAWGAFERAAASPGMARAVIEAWTKVDLGEVLPAVRVPTLVLHRTGDFLNVEGGRYIGNSIPGARYVELPGHDHLPWIGDSDRVVEKIEEFLTGARHAGEPPTAGVARRAPALSRTLLRLARRDASGGGTRR